MTACPTPIEARALADYWFGELDVPNEERLEEHLFGCAACSRRLHEIAALGEGVRQLAGQGLVHVVITPSFLRAAARNGLRVREYALAPGEQVACTVTPDDDLVVARLCADFAGVATVDLRCQVEGFPEQRIEDVPVDPGSRELIVSQAMPTLRALGPSVTRLRLVARRGSEERLLGEYVFNHTPAR